MGSYAVELVLVEVEPDVPDELLPDDVDEPEELLDVDEPEDEESDAEASVLSDDVSEEDESVALWSDDVSELVEFWEAAITLSVEMSAWSPSQLFWMTSMTPPPLIDVSAASTAF